MRFVITNKSLPLNPWAKVSAFCRCSAPPVSMGLVYNDASFLRFRCYTCGLEWRVPTGGVIVAKSIDLLPDNVLIGMDVDPREVAYSSNSPSWVLKVNPLSVKIHVGVEDYNSYSVGDVLRVEG